jgi:hypothetical protein
MSAMSLPRPSMASLKARGSAVVKWIVGGGLLVGLILAVTQCQIARIEAQRASVQTYNLSRVAAFRDSGAELDKRIAAFNDAAAEGRDLIEPRQAVRSALADHAAKTMAMQDAFGLSATQAYERNLKRLQAAVEDATDASNSGPIITAMSQTIVQRNKMAQAVTDRATS